MGKLYSAFMRAEAIAAAALLLLMVAMIFLGGLFRLAREPQNWMIDVATCSFAWACFLAADVAWRNNALMSLDLWGERSSATLRMALRYANLLIIALFLIYLAYAGFWLSWVSRTRTFQGIPGVSYSLVTLSLPVGAMLLLLTTARKIRSALRADGLLGSREPTSREPTSPET